MPDSSIYDEFVDTCIHERSFGWIVQKVKGLPTKAEVDAAVKHVDEIGQRAEGLVAEVEKVIDDATAAAKEEIRQDLADSIGAIEEAEQSVLANAKKVQQVIDDATETAKQELKASIAAEVQEVQSAKEEVLQVKDQVNQVVTDATEVVKTQISQEIDQKYDAKERALQTYVESQTNTAKQDLQNYVTEQVTSTKNSLNSSINNTLEAAEKQLDSNNEQRIAQAVTGLSGELAQKINQKFQTATLTIYTGDWIDKQCTKTFAGADPSKIIFVTYAPDSSAQYIDNEVVCTGAALEQLSFKCSFTPTEAINVYIVAVG